MNNAEMAPTEVKTTSSTTDQADSPTIPEPGDISGMVTADGRADVELFVRTHFGDATGKVVTAIGGPPRWIDGVNGTIGKYDNQVGWDERIHDYPGDFDVIVDRLYARREVRDSYLCTGLGYLNRKEGSLKQIWSLHVDWDGEPRDTATVLETISEYGGFAVLTGSAGHVHGFIPLSKPITIAAHYKDLCQAFHRQLPTGAEKVAWNDVLRVPGTFNLKPTVRPGDTGVAAPVTWAVRP